MTKKIKTTNTFFSALMVISLAVPLGLFAQTTAPALENNLPETVVEPSVSVDAGSSVNIQTGSSSGVSVSPQDTNIGQETFDSKSIEQTFNPNEAMVDDSASSTTIGAASSAPEVPEIPVEQSTTTNPLIIPIEDPIIIASSTPVEDSGGVVLGTSTSTGPSIASSTPDNPIPPVTEISNVSTSTSVVDVIVKKEPNSKFSFKLRGKGLATHKTPNWQKNHIGDGDDKKIKDNKNSNTTADIVTEATVTPSTQNGLVISGQCLDKYFVVLLYAKAEDYDQNPVSYIYNKAFDCVNGQYSYSLNDLSETIKNGDYYLLIASQGDRGSWSPITSLAPVTIERQ